MTVRVASARDDLIARLGERRIDPESYPMLAAYAPPLLPPVQEIIGREKEKMQILASMARPRLSNLILLAPAGAGKTVAVQETMLSDPDRFYLEVDLARMISNLRSQDELASKIKKLFDEAERYARDEHQELVLFIDEFHQIVQLSAAAVEALKPVLAASGSRGIRVITATTFEEYHQHISSNKALEERLPRLNLTPAGESMVIEILRNMAKQEGVLSACPPGDGLFRQIFELTNRYVPSSVQPRKSIQVLDQMIGWHRVAGDRMNFDLVAKVLANWTGIDIAMRLDGAHIKEELDKRVFSQQGATMALSNILQLVVADLNDKSRPSGSFLFTGSTGVGKTELTKALAELMFGDDGQRLVRFDMSEFFSDESVHTLRSELTRQVWNMGHCVVLLDEIEKASPHALRLLLQVLDDGRLSDDNGRQVSFLNCYIIMTTNAASNIYKGINQYVKGDTGSAEDMKKFTNPIMDALRKVSGFPTELLNRIDSVVPFQPLSADTRNKIILRGLRQLYRDVLEKHEVKLDIDEALVTYLSEDVTVDDTDSGGARGAMRALKHEVSVAVAIELNKYPDADSFYVGLQGTMRAEDKRRRLSGAKPVVLRERPLDRVGSKSTIGGIRRDVS